MYRSMKDYAPVKEADESNQPRKREMMHQKGSDMDGRMCVRRYTEMKNIGTVDLYMW